ncbi:DUF5389 domain-containing protein [Pasteurellaceae bacterium TAE3-ERU1]|uniref:DUF5389 family protein n=1 Tax=Spirabiliibacterium mucosae TaxID=28156 RepID=UPI001AAE015C|nr:DUF5389 family protein [Spirabiliibacterium mucosae]MBV7388178.1 DUF5389 domain-containing protein [Pasteurellaceae bacterium TAE3-ERU1]
MAFKTALWVLAAPIILWPFALLLSPYVGDSPALTATQANGVATLMWAYPLAIALMIALLRWVYPRAARVAWGLAALAIAVVYWQVIAIAYLF